MPALNFDVMAKGILAEPRARTVDGFPDFIQFFDQIGSDPYRHALFFCSHSDIIVKRWLGFVNGPGEKTSGRPQPRRRGVAQGLDGEDRQRQVGPPPDSLFQAVGPEAGGSVGASGGAIRLALAGIGKGSGEDRDWARGPVAKERGGLPYSAKIATISS